MSNKMVAFVDTYVSHDAAGVAVLDTQIVDGLHRLVTVAATDQQSREVEVNNFPASQAVTGVFWQAVQPVSATALPLPTGAASEATLAALSAKNPALGQAAMAASVPVVLANNQSAIPVATHAVTQSGTWNVTQTLATAATGGATAANVAAAAGTNATVVKASNGRLYGFHFMNNGTATAYVKLHNLATAPTVGTTAVAMAIAIPPANSVTAAYPFGVAFSAGISYSIVGGAANNSTVAVANEQVVGHLIYA